MDSCAPGATSHSSRFASRQRRALCPRTSWRCLFTPCVAIVAGRHLWWPPIRERMKFRGISRQTRSPCRACRRADSSRRRATLLRAFAVFGKARVVRPIRPRETRCARAPGPRRRARDASDHLPARDLPHIGRRRSCQGRANDRRRKSARTSPASMSADRPVLYESANAARPSSEGCGCCRHAHREPRSLSWGDHRSPCR